MPTVVISYDLSKPARDYPRISGAITKLGKSRNILGSVWILQSPHNAKTVRDYLEDYIDSNDHLFVGVLTGEMAWRRLDSADAEWLKSHV